MSPKPRGPRRHRGAWRAARGGRLRQSEGGPARARRDRARAAPAVRRRQRRKRRHRGQRRRPAAAAVADGRRRDGGRRRGRRRRDDRRAAAAAVRGGAAAVPAAAAAPPAAAATAAPGGRGGARAAPAVRRRGAGRQRAAARAACDGWRRREPGPPASAAARCARRGASCCAKVSRAPSGTRRPRAGRGQGTRPIADDQAARGAHALKLTPAADKGYGFFVYGNAEAFGAAHWGRLFYRVQTPPPDAFVHATMAAYQGDGPGHRRRRPSASSTP